MISLTPFGHLKSWYCILIVFIFRRILCEYARYDEIQADEMFSVVEEACRVGDRRFGVPNLTSARGQMLSSKACISLRQKFAQVSRSCPSCHLCASKSFSNFVTNISITFEQLSAVVCSSFEEVTANYTKSKSLLVNLKKSRKEQDVIGAHFHGANDAYAKQVSCSQESESKLQARQSYLDEDLASKISAQHSDGADDCFLKTVSNGLNEQILFRHLASLRSFLGELKVGQVKEIANLRKSSAAAEQKLAGNVNSFVLDIGPTDGQVVSELARADKASKRMLHYKMHRLQLKEEQQCK